MLNENNEQMRIKLMEVARECNEDEKIWAKIADVILGTDFEKNYCSLKASIEKNLINAENINVNPLNVDTSDDECSTIMNSIMSEYEEQVRNKYKQDGKTNSQIDCVMNLYKNAQHFDFLIAKDSLEKNQMDVSIRRTHIGKIKDGLSTHKINDYWCIH